MNIPTIPMRLHNLEPSKQLLEFYREKVKKFDTQQDDLVEHLDRYTEIQFQSYLS